MIYVDLSRQIYLIRSVDNRSCFVRWDVYDTALAHKFAGCDLYQMAFAHLRTANIKYKIYMICFVTRTRPIRVIGGAVALWIAPPLLCFPYLVRVYSQISVAG